MLERGLLREDQIREVLVKEGVQRQRLLKGAGGGVGGRRRLEVSAPEVLASFNLPIEGEKSQVLNEDRIAQVVAGEAGLPYKKIDPLKLDMKLITSLLSRPFARRHDVLVISLESGVMTVAIADPYDVELVENLRRITGYKISPVIAAKSDIQRIITEVYGFRSSVKAAAQTMKVGSSRG